MRRHKLVLAPFVVLFALTPARAAPAGPPEAGVKTGKPDRALLARADELWKRRDEPAALAEMKALLDKALAAAPNDYDVLWRATLYHVWLSDDPQRSRDERTKLGKAGWELGERAIAANPGGVEGHFFTAACMGNYSLGIGILRALAQRIEGKFTARLADAERIDPGFANAAIPATWGRYHASLPWPKHSAKKATAQYKRAIEMNPHHLRARVYWAELLLDEDEPEAAKKLLDEVARAQPGRYDAPEERRAKLLGAELMPRVLEKLK